MINYKVCQLVDLPPGSRKIIDVKGKSIGVFNVKGKLTAVKNTCPHQGAPLCKGRIRGMTVSNKDRELEFIKQDEILMCPWHGWEFDLMNGKSITNPDKCRTKQYDVSIYNENADPVETYDVSVESDTVYVHV